MNTTPTELDSVLARVAAVRKERDELEGRLAGCRHESRQLAITLIFDHGYSLAKTCALTGHMRPTLRVWIQSEILKRADEGKTSPSGLLG